MSKNSKKQTNTAAETVDRVERFEADDGRLGYRVAWRYIAMPFFLSHNERIHEFIETVDPTSGEKMEQLTHNIAVQQPEPIGSRCHHSRFYAYLCPFETTTTSHIGIFRLAHTLQPLLVNKQNQQDNLKILATNHGRRSSVIQTAASQLIFASLGAVTRSVTHMVAWMVDCVSASDVAPNLA
ncbi:hypothetical protein FVEG_17353 [Fusarium verticillioides 7600]|uniref:Uncharacterized protein n=1 Tax=Gibberella moniliformis (strain M3125 / FGSC 7600) TaxID=334819 RepID=W7NEB1_GIBM7|nr:hypothetical protein FVEG_17353 [Fusarium verticillioides 7600]EWG54657.1 hypothetical protein FVEG_17353 [Fusarium verticillioides 7600]